MKDENLQKYEIMLILNPEMGEEKTKHELDEIRELISSNGGKIENEDLWGVRDMAYNIKKHEKGYYAVFNLTMDALKVKEFEKPMNINQVVLRYMILRTPDKYVLKTLKEYEEERQKELEEKKKSQEEKDKEEMAKRTKTAAPTKKIIKKKEEEPAEEKEEKKTAKKVEKAEEAEEEAPKKETKPEKKISTKNSKSTLEEVDKKLKSIIDDPDITL